MSEPVKRTYTSALRDEQARATRRTVVAAAHELFVTGGWSATSIDAIAAAAGVSRATVFAVGSKVELLKLAYDTAVGGDDAPVPMAQRRVVDRIEQATDPEEFLARYVELVLAVGSRLADVYVAMRSAADADVRVRALFDEVQRQRAAGATGWVRSLRSRGMLRTDLDPAAAADIAWVLIDPGVYAALVGDRGWSPARFASWLTDTLRSQLLGP